MFIYYSISYYTMFEPSFLLKTLIFTNFTRFTICRCSTWNILGIVSLIILSKCNMCSTWNTKIRILRISLSKDIDVPRGT